MNWLLPFEEFNPHINPSDLHSGMRLRDYIAVKAMLTLLNDPALDASYETIARDSYQIADLMLYERYIGIEEDHKKRSGDEPRQEP